MMNLSDKTIKNTYLLGIKPMTLIRIGLGVVFLANSLTAFFMPSEFVELIEKSFLTNLLPINPAVFVAVIGINDALVATLLLLNVSRKWLRVWAAAWIIAVMLVKGTPLNILEESGFLLMALALIRNNIKGMNADQLNLID